MHFKVNISFNRLFLSRWDFKIELQKYYFDTKRLLLECPMNLCYVLTVLMINGVGCVVEHAVVADQPKVPPEVGLLMKDPKKFSK